jgi:putative nucleotidyltransferase with HDIG domain
MAILFALAKALEARDDNTSTHSLNVTRYSMLLGQRLGLDEDQLRALGQGAMLHDLGKIGIPDNILKKPGELDDVELERIREHPKLTSEILAPLETSNHFSDIARSHHERWDGKGYPDGLNGEDIPLLARIVAIADSWDAMTSNRVYREGMSEYKALSILEREKNLGQWDPYLINEFIQLIRHENGFDAHNSTG